MNEGNEAPLRVLAVDDNPAVLRFLGAALSSANCQVMTAETAEVALGLIDGESFDLVLSDIKMPGLSGLDLLRAIKGRQPETPVVLITGVPSVNSAVFGLRHGAYDYLPKPFTVTEVRQLVERLRVDRAQGLGPEHLPAGLTAEIARRQEGVGALARIGELALEGLTPDRFMARAVESCLKSVSCDAGLILLHDQHGRFTVTRRGDPSLGEQLLGVLRAHFHQVVASAGQEAYVLAAPDHGIHGLAAVIPGVDDAMAIMCLGRGPQVGAFLPDEKALVLGYARATSVAFQKIVLREHLEKNLVDTISAFVVALESKDPYLKGHSTRVSLYSAEAAGAMGMPEPEVTLVSRAGMLHDLGKLVTFDHILRKPDRLTDEEYELIRSHPVVGDKILKPLRFLACEAKAVRHHHERYDGMGYPDGLQGEDIPLIARVVTVADAFDAMTSDRPYRARRPLDAALEELVRGVRGQFDPAVVDAFTAVPLARLEDISRRLDLRSPPPVPAPTS